MHASSHTPRNAILMYHISHHVATDSRSHSTRPRTASIGNGSPNPPRRIERVLGKRPRERLLRADLLTTDETLDCDGDGTVDVGGGAVLAEAHFAESLADTDDGFEVTDLAYCIRRVMMRGREITHSDRICTSSE